VTKQLGTDPSTTIEVKWVWQDHFNSTDTTNSYFTQWNHVQALFPLTGPVSTPQAPGQPPGAAANTPPGGPQLLFTGLVSTAQAPGQLPGTAANAQPGVPQGQAAYVQPGGAPIPTTGDSVLTQACQGEGADLTSTTIKLLQCMTDHLLALATPSMRHFVKL
jgi:hypothetical protein